MPVAPPVEVQGQAHGEAEEHDEDDQGEREVDGGDAGQGLAVQHGADAPDAKDEPTDAEQRTIQVAALQGNCAEDGSQYRQYYVRLNVSRIPEIMNSSCFGSSRCTGVTLTTEISLRGHDSHAAREKSSALSG